ncbi:MAG TPA: hypothetical protein DCR04_11595 [Flavobacteriales bacterium]|jgi:transposase|nr:hypothetical protein [Flavobacteriales bacterium]
MKRTKRVFSSAFKAEVALEAIKGVKTVSELAQKYELHPAQITQWKKQFLDQSASVFESDKKKNEELDQLKKERDELFRQMGELKFENNWYKKNSNDAAIRKDEACRYAQFRGLHCTSMQTTKPL